MDIKLIHKPSKNNVVPNALSRKEEYQGEMPWENTRIFQTMFIGENNLEKKIWNAYVENCLVQSYFNDLC